MFITNLTINIPVTNDEVSTLANNAHLLNWDWRPFLESSGNYYFKYAQALLYLPLFFIFHNPPTLLHAMLTVNSLLTALIAPVCYDLSRKYLKIESVSITFWVSLVAGLTPAPLLYAGYARADIAIIVMPWLVLWLLMKNTDYKEKSKKKFILCTVLISFFSVFAFMAHTRGVVLIIATVMIILFAALYLKQKLVHYPVYVISTAVLLVIDRFLTKYFKNTIWGADSAKGASVENFDFQALLQIFTPEGFASMVKLIIGWVFNMFTSTYGLSSLGLVVCAILLVKSFSRQKSLSSYEIVVNLFIVLYFLGTFAMSALFFFRPVHAFYTQMGTTRGDRLIFDRYICSALPFLCFTGLYGLICKKELIGLKSKTASLVFQAAFLALFARFVSFRLDNVSVDRKYFIALNTFVGFRGGATVINLENLSSTLILTGIVALAVYFIFLLLTSLNKHMKVFLMSFCVIFLLSYGICFVKAKYLVARQYEKAVSTTVAITETLGDLYKEYPYILKDTQTNGGKSWQFALPYYDCINKKYSGAESIDNMIIVNGKIPFNAKWYDDDYYIFASLDYSGSTRNMPYIKGEELNAEINRRGIETIKVTPDMITQQ